MSYPHDCRICQEITPFLTCRLCRTMSIDHFLLHVGIRCETCRSIWFNNFRAWVVRRDREGIPEDHDCLDHPRHFFQEPPYREEN